MPRSLLSLVITGVTIVGLSALACSGAIPETQSEAVGDPADGEPRTGEQIFAATCAACHGANGEGAENWMVRGADGRLPPPPLNGDGHTWHHSDGVLYRIVSEGGAGIGFGSNMPSFKDELTREEIIAVLEYIKTLWESKEADGLPISDFQREFSEADPYPEKGN